MMTNTNPIGIFDSGLGGLTVAKTIQKLLPHESVIYFGDTARLPYGNKSPKIIKKYSLQIADFLISKGAKIIVIACNTASALALNEVQKHAGVPVVGVIDPGVKAAIHATRNKHIGVIGTVATIRSKEYENRIKATDHTMTVISQPCPLFVPLVEEGWLDGSITKAIANIYLKPFKTENIDTLVLGCTHYPLLKPLLISQTNQKIVLVDSAEPVAEKIFDLLKTSELQSNSHKNGTLSCYISDVFSQFKTIAERFLEGPIADVTTVDLL